MYKLLIIEDNKVQLESVLTFIGESQFNFSEIRTASNGLDGLSLYREFHPDIIISDVFMPLMTGIDMIKEIRKSDKSVKIIIISAYQDFDYVKNAIDNDVTSYVLKPLRFTEFSNSIDQVIKLIDEKHEVVTLRKMSKESIIAYRENFLYSLRFSFYNNTKYIEQFLNNLAFEQYHSFVMLNFELCTDGEDTPEFAAVYDLYSLIKSNLLIKLEGIAIIESNCKILALIYSDTPCSDKALNETIHVVHSFMTAVSEKCGLCSVGMSRMSDSIHSSFTMLKQATNALENKYSPVIDEIYLYEDIDYENVEYSSTNIKNGLEMLIENFDSVNANAFIEEYFPENPDNKVAIKSFCFTVVSAMQNILIERNHDIKDVLGILPWEKLGNFDTILNPKQWLKNLLIAVCEYIKSNEQSKYHKIINDIKDYINIHYKDISNIEQITSNLYISVSYAKFIFKKYAGESIFDYLTKARIDIAKQLLCDPYVKVYEVCERVGYKSKNHFTKIFKKYVGISPYDYQLNYAKKSHIQ